MVERTPAVFTIGHSNHAFECFAALLASHGVTAVADVRSTPYSRFNPHFSRDVLAATLRRRDFDYVYLGRQLGGRSDDAACYENGRVRYDRVALSAPFLEGIERVIQGAKVQSIALMCAEKEPLNCHRTLLVAPALASRGVEVVHIHANGDLEAHATAMDRLLAKFDLRPENDLFRQSQPRSALIAEALALQARRVAYMDSETVVESARRT